jgi:hypothetical protein
MRGIGGPQTSEERAAVITNEIVQAIRMRIAHERHRKIVIMVNRLRSPQAICMKVSTC